MRHWKATAIAAAFFVLGIAIGAAGGIAIGHKGGSGAEATLAERTAVITRKSSTRTVTTALVAEEGLPLGGTLNVTFSQAGDVDTERRFYLGCEPLRGPTCEEAGVKEALLFPETPGLACPLPTTAWVVRLRGTWNGRRIHVTYLPCDKPSSRAIEAWMDLWDFSPPA